MIAAEVETIHKHPLYLTKEVDIALLQTKNDIEIDKNSFAGKDRWSSNKDIPNEAGTTRLCGWGSIENDVDYGEMNCLTYASVDYGNVTGKPHIWKMYGTKQNDWEEYQIACRVSKCFKLGVSLF